MIIEACVETVAAAHHAVAGGASRLELCADLDRDGMTPSDELLTAVIAAVPVPVHAMVRHRPGDFVYSEHDVAVMAREAARAAALGAPGLVFGALTRTGEIDADAVRRIRNAAPAATMTFHRAFDACRDPLEALDALLDLGVERLLTSGQQPTAWQGRDLLAELVRRAAGRLVVMAGGKVRQDHAAELVAATGVTELHLRGSAVFRW